MAKSKNKTGWFVIASLMVGYIIGNSGSEVTTPDANVRTVNVPMVPVPIPTPQIKKVSVAPTSAKPVALNPIPKMDIEATQTLYVTTKLNVRDKPSTKSTVVGQLAIGSSVSVGASDGPWRQLQNPAKLQGAWVHGDYLTNKQVSVPKPQPLVSKPKLKPKVNVAPSRGASGTPVRAARTGSCDCPYDRMRNGRQCGGNSAYSRPGGRSPICYN